jgi:cation transport regulator ChaC
MPKTVGILAYGSLIDNPGPEIEGGTVDTKRGITTPFNVEFARSSKKRGGAPTLVPVEGYGSPVQARMFILNVDEEEATHRLYRREINDKTGKKKYSYPDPETPGDNTVFVKRLNAFEGVDVVLYTSIRDTIGIVPAAALAERAIESVAATDDGRDGISYLMNAKAQGIRTAISEAYEEEIKQQTGAASLEEAIRKARALADGTGNAP